MKSLKKGFILVVLLAATAISFIACAGKKGAPKQSEKELAFAEYENLISAYKTVDPADTAKIAELGDRCIKLNEDLERLMESDDWTSDDDSKVFDYAFELADASLTASGF